VLTQEEIHKIAAVESSHWWYCGTREIFFSMLAPYVEGRGPLRILDIGCGTGGNLLELSRLGEAHGVDVDPLCVKYCKDKGLDCTVGNMATLEFAPAAFDLVTMFDVLTQAESKDTERILCGIANVLAPNGLLAFRETAMLIAAGAHDKAVGVLQRFTKAGLVSILKRTGFEPQRVSYVNTLLFPPIVVARRLQHALNPDHAESDVRPTTPLLNATLLGVLRVEKVLLRYTDLPFGVSIFGVARKA
jgi:SAM-dependent methyltransferase